MIDGLAVCRAMGLPSNEWQDRIVMDSARHVMIRAARRVGKSFVGAKRAFVQKVIQKGTRGWIVGPSYELAEKEFRYLLEFARKFSLMEGFPKPYDVRENTHGGNLQFTTAWGSQVIGKSSAKGDQLVGEELDWVLMSEAALHKPETWERYLRPTLTTRKGISIWPFTPDVGGLWLHEMEMAAIQLPDWSSYTCAAWECSHYDTGEIAAAKRELSVDAFAEQYGGEWRFYRGRVYQVSEGTHWVRPFAIPKTWKVYSSTDFGSSQPTCTLWGAVSPDRQLYLFDEYYYDPRKTMATRSAREHVRAMVEVDQRHASPAMVRIADHHGLGEQLIRDFGVEGWVTVPCRSEDRQSRRDRTIAACTSKEGPAPYHVREAGSTGPASYPDLFILKGACPQLTREMNWLTWKDGTRDGATQGDDHAIDALEYLAEYAGIGVTVRRKHDRMRGERQRQYSRTGYYAYGRESDVRRGL